MSMKNTDLEKRLAKKLVGRMKSSVLPRFGKGTLAAEPNTELKPKNVAAKLVPVSCRLPAELVARLRDRAIGFEGGMNVLMAQAVELWLGSTAGATTAPAEA